MADHGRDIEGETRLVQCGWCPMILADDYVVWYLHFREVHGYGGGYSVRPIRGTDWDVAELTEHQPGGA